MNQIDITGLDPARVLQELHNSTRSIGMGVYHDFGPISLNDARVDMERNQPRRNYVPDGKGGFTDVLQVSFDYLRGRPLKIGIHTEPDGRVILSGVRLYDQDAPTGDGACQRAVDRVRAEPSKDAPRV